MPEKAAGFLYDLGKWVAGALATMGLIITGWIHSRINRVHRRIDLLEERIVTKDQFAEYKDADRRAHRQTHRKLNHLLTKNNKRR